MQSKHKTQRLEYRATPSQKKQIQHAANLAGRSESDFAINTLQEAAAKVIREHEIISLSMNDQKAFIQALSNPPEPSKRLLKAKQKFDKKVEND